jgi:potassium-transporting ATPase KdpC subunit
MLAEALKQIKTGLVLLIFFSVLTGLIYPAIVTGIAQILFPWKANGSIIKLNGKPIGSSLIGQQFTDDKYFWGRPSATTPYPYNAENSGGSNYGPMNEDLLNDVKSRVGILKVADYSNANPVPVDLVTSSGSGLDPEISPYAAFYQSVRIAKARGIEADEVVNKLIQNTIKGRTFDILGEPRVNVLRLNLALDALTSAKSK